MGIQPNVELLHIEDKDILKITVEKSSVPIAYKNKYYKRVGNTTREANKEELKKLLLKDISWDSITNSSTLDDIDEKTVQKFVKLATNKGRLPEEAKELSITDLLTQLELIIDNKLTMVQFYYLARIHKNYYRQQLLGLVYSKVMMNL